MILLVIDEFKFLTFSLGCKCILMHSVKLLTTYIEAIVGTNTSFKCCTNVVVDHFLDVSQRNAMNIIKVTTIN